MRALMTAMVSCRLRTSANVRCSWAAEVLHLPLVRTTPAAERQSEDPERAEQQGGTADIITVSIDGFGRISNIAAPVTAVTLRQESDAEMTALHRRKQQTVQCQALAPASGSQNFALADRKNCRGAPSSSDCHVPFGSVSVKPFESIVLKYSLSVTLVASSWIDSSSNAPKPRKR